MLKLMTMLKVWKAIQNYKTSWPHYQAKLRITIKLCSPNTGLLQNCCQGSSLEKSCREHFTLPGIFSTPDLKLNNLKTISWTIRENFLEGSVNVEGREKSILLQGYESLNRAVDGDCVAVELLPENLWTAPSGVVLEDQEEYDPGIGTQN